jgi:hypothetical protein
MALSAIPAQVKRDGSFQTGRRGSAGTHAGALRQTGYRSSHEARLRAIRGTVDAQSNSPDLQHLPSLDRFRGWRSQLSADCFSDAWADLTARGLWNPGTEPPVRVSRRATTDGGVGSTRAPQAGGSGPMRARRIRVERAGLSPGSLSRFSPDWCRGAARRRTRASAAMGGAPVAVVGSHNRH